MNICSTGGVCDESVFATIFKIHAKSLRNFVYYKFGNEEKANDATQDAFIKLWENCVAVEPQKAKSYLYTVANNACLNQIAHQKVVLEYAKNANLNSHTLENPEFILEEQEFKTKLHQAIENLVETQRTAFLMHRIDGRKYHEIAETLGISVKAVEKRISGALVSLRLTLQTSDSF